MDMVQMTPEPETGRETHVTLGGAAVALTLDTAYKASDDSGTTYT